MLIVADKGVSFQDRVNILIEVSIRKASRADAKQLSGIALAAKRHWNYPEPWFKLWGDVLKITPEFIQNNNVWVADHNNQIVGFAAISINKSIADLEHIWIIPEHMRKGVGENLINKVIEYCQFNSIEKLRIESDPNSRIFYEKMGAKLIGYVESKPKPRTLPVLEIEL